MAREVKSALRGRIVTMDANDTVIDDGALYVLDGAIHAIQDAGATPPAGFSDVAIRTTNGTLYPGLIDLHNHLSYNALRLWRVPKRYTNRDQWVKHPDYRRLISGPMTVLGKTEGYPAAIARYAECKCLFSGVTTSQGIALNSNGGMSTFYDGLLRNPEKSDGAMFPAAKTRIDDVAAGDADAFLERLARMSCLLLHLSEGTDERARRHFEALTLPDGRVAITPALAGIHCVALKRDDFRLLATRGGSMIWSPMSNLLLYGATANVRVARQEGVVIALGSDWSPSGSKNLLCELKAARAMTRAGGNPFSDRELLAMVTRNPAKILKWEGAVGSLEAGKRADVVVVRGQDREAYAQLLDSKETDVLLVMIDGQRRYGLPRLMAGANGPLEAWKVGGLRRMLDLSESTAAPLEPLSLRAAANRLKQGLRDLKQLAIAIENRPPAPPDALAPTRWFLELEEEEPPGTSIRPRFADGASAPRKVAAAMAAAALSLPLSKVLGPLKLDALTVVDDGQFLPELMAQLNLPEDLKVALGVAYA